MRGIVAKTLRRASERGYSKTSPNTYTEVGVRQKASYEAPQRLIDPIVTLSNECPRYWYKQLKAKYKELNQSDKSFYKQLLLLDIGE